jgi:hypothetical protein
MPVYNRIKNISIVDPNDPSLIAGVTASGELKVSTNVTLESQEITVENVSIRDGDVETDLAYIDSEGNLHAHITEIPPVVVSGTVHISGEVTNDGITKIRDGSDPNRVATVGSSGDVLVNILNDPVHVSGQVEITSGIVQVQYTGSNLKLDELTKDDLLTNGSYDTVYNHIASGEVQKIIQARLIFDSNNIDVKVTTDSSIIINELSLDELYREYKLDTSLNDITEGSVIRTEDQGRVLMLNFHPDGLKYTDFFKIEAKANQTNIYLNRGKVTRVEGNS